MQSVPSFQTNYALDHSFSSSASERGHPLGIGAVAVICILLLSGIAHLAADSESGDGQPENAKSMDFPGRTLVPWYWTDGRYGDYEPLGKYDANGTFVYNWSGTWVYHPYMIGRVATEIYNNWYYTNDSTPLSKFRDQISWIRANEKQFGDHSLWFFNFTVNARTQDPWWSSVGNAWIIASLLDSYALDGNPVDLEIAWRGIKSFEYGLEDHGVLTNWNGTGWYEEEATNNTLVVQTPSHTINGMIVATAGARYIYAFNSSAHAKQLFDNGLASINAHAKEFDLGMWEKYSVLNQRANPEGITTLTMLFNWIGSASNNASMQAWGKRLDWMSRLPSLGYSPVNITADKTLDPIGYGTDRLVDKQLTLFTKSRYWSARVPSSLTFNLGSNEPVNFIGYYGLWPSSSPKNYTVQTSLDGVKWVLRGAVSNSTDVDKCLVFDNPIQVRYAKFTFYSVVSNSTVVGLDEIVIANLTADDLYEAKLSIEDPRFKNVEGRLAGTVPAGTVIEIDGNLTTEAGGSAGSYCYSLPNGEHSIGFRYNGSNLNATIYVKYAWTVYFNVTAYMMRERISPVAVAGVDQTVREGTVVTFNGSLSSDNVGVKNYTWTFNYSGVLTRLYGAAPSFKFDVPGTYNVTLTVMDEADNSDSDGLVVTVSSTASEKIVLSVAVILIVIAMLTPWIIISRKRKRLRNQKPENEPPESKPEN